MKNLSIPIALLFMLFVISSCKDKCESEKTGAVLLNELSQSYTPYQDEGSLLFINDTGEEMAFTAEVVNETYPICVDYLCVQTDPYQSRPCEYYEANGIRNLLRSGDTLIIELVVSTQNYESESTLFYDLFTIHISKIGTLASGEYIPYVDFTNPTFDPSKVSLDLLMTEVAEITLLGKTYTDVIHTEEGTDMIYIKKGQGVVGIKMNGILWGLE